MKTTKIGKRGGVRRNGHVLARPGPVMKFRVQMTEKNGHDSEPVTADVSAEHATSERTEHAQAPALQLYLREIGQVKLLTPKEERALARRIKRGDAQAREHMI